LRVFTSTQIANAPTGAPTERKNRTMSDTNTNAASSTVENNAAADPAGTTGD
jgi:hypothetical protein